MHKQLLQHRDLIRLFNQSGHKGNLLLIKFVYLYNWREIKELLVMMLKVDSFFDSFLDLNEDWQELKKVDQIQVFNIEPTKLLQVNRGQ